MNTLNKSSRYHEIITLRDSERNIMESVLSESRYPFNGVSAKSVTNKQLDNFVLDSYISVACALPKKVLSALVKLKSNCNTSSVLLIKNTPIDKDRPRIPIQGTREQYYTTTSIGESFLTGVGAILGEPIGHAEEKRGNLIHDVTPIQNTDIQLSNEGSSDFGLHIENAIFPNRERYLILSCIRPDHDKQATTPVVDVRDILAELPHWACNELRKPNYKIRKPYVLNRSEVIEYSSPTAIISGPDSAPDVRVTLYAQGTKSLCKEADRALSLFSKVANDLAVAYKLDKGDMVIIHNYTALHGRSAFTPKFDGYDRHLIRIYIADSLWPLRKEQKHSNRILSRSK